ncbi:MAG: stage II sporulation protein P [Bacilli bacterium]|nr:stage II sporulation protein P [Bacilli bacterium]
MKKIKLKKRKFKFRLFLYAFIMFLGYQISFNIIMNIKLVSSNEEFIKTLLVDSNYHLLYEKKATNLLTKIWSKIIDVNKPVSILKNTLHFNPNKNEPMAYINNPNIKEVEKLEAPPSVYIYNTHQGESYQGKALEGYNIKPSVMMASYILQDKLAQNNVKADVMQDNIADYLNLNNMKYNKSYLASRKFLMDALSKYKDYKLIIDLHRDSLSKDKSTTIINNKSCAKISFVVGQDHDNYEANLNKTNNINEKIKQKYPNLTRGVLVKGGKGSNGIYNQDLSPNIILIEIGGQENTIDEVLNTIELLSPIIKENINA